MNISNLQILLQEAINNATTPIQYLQLAKAIQALNVGQIRSVASFSNLPSAASNEGLLVFVVADARLYWSTGTDWYDVTINLPSSSWAWGDNSYGQLGTNNTTARSSPVSVVGGFTDWCQVSINTPSLGVRSNGTVWAWGNNSFGQLGDETTVAKSSPVSVIGGFTDWCYVAASSAHSLGVRKNGTAWAWGDNSRGQLGNGSVGSNQSSPVSVVGGFTDWCQVSAGRYHSLGVRTNGTAWAWGWQCAGRLGNGIIFNGNVASPVSVLGGFSDWSQVSAGNTHGLGVRTNGTAWAWGCNTCGILGDNSVVTRSSPVSVVGGFTDWCQVSAGNQHSLGVRSNGTAWAWGLGFVGQLGIGINTVASSPVSVVGGFTDWCQVSAGRYHSLGVRTNGTAWAWGCNGSGILGTGDSVNRSSPASVAGGVADWCQVSAGSAHSMAVRRS